MPAAKGEMHNVLEGGAKVLGVAKRVWRYLIASSGDASNLELQHRIRLLLGLMVVLIPLAFLFLTIQALFFPSFWPGPVAGAMAILFLVLAYMLARVGFYRSAACVAIGTTSLVALAMALFNPGNVFVYAFLFVGIFLAGLLFSERGVWLSATFNLLAVIWVLPALGASSSPPDPVIVPAFLIMLSVLLLLSIRHRDAVERTRRAELAMSEDRFRTLAEATLEGIVFTENGRILDINERGAALFGMTRAELVGRSVLEFCIAADRKRAAENIRNNTTTPYELTAIRADGSKFPIEVCGRTTQYRGRPVRTTVVRDLTEQKRAEEVRRESESQLKEAQRLASLGSWDLDLVTGKFKCSEEIFRIFEVDPASTNEYYEDFLEAIHPEDREMVDAAYRDSVRSHEPYEFVHRLQMKDGRIKHVHERGETYYDAQGKPVRSVGTVQDVTVRIEAELALIQSESNFRALTENANVGIMVNHRGKHVFANNKLLDLLGYTLEQLRDTGVKDLVHPAEFDKVMERFRERLAGRPQPNVYETVFVTRDGDPVPVELSAAKTTWLGEPAGLVFLHDIRERLRAENQMRKLSSALEQTADSVLITNREGVIEYVNAAFEKTTGYTRDEVIGQNPRLIKSDRHAPAFYKKLWETILAGKVFSDILINRHKNGTLYYEEKTISPLKDHHGQIMHFVSTGKDVTERMHTQERLQFMAQHDALTELPNRLLLIDRLHQALTRAHWHQRLVAVLFVDMDRFKTINDTLGHESGDRLLQTVANRLAACVREGDTVARFGGDEFVILLDDVAAADDIVVIAQKILDSLIEPFVLDNQSLYTTASIGVSLYPYDGKDSSSLLKNADIAMYRAKERGKNTYQFYSADMSARALERLSLESNLRRALDRDEFRLYYQPQVDTRSGAIVGVEALLRWQHPQTGLVLPVDFIPLLEETGLIVPVGEWILNQACEQLKIWHGRGWSALRLAINLSPRQFLAPALGLNIERGLDRIGCVPGMLEFEITEGILLGNTATTLGTLEELRELGVRLAIDDFGTGYSSLNYLSRYAIHTLKIDRSFVRAVADNGDDSVITAAIIGMAQNLRMGVIAEGVENEAQRDFLNTRGCFLMQGNWFSQPLTVEGMTDFLQVGRDRSTVN